MKPARAMAESDLDRVAAVEAQAHAHPWSRGNFADALKAGYRSWLWEDDHDELLGYALVSQVLDEAELLDITVSPNQQGRGLGQRFLGQVLADCHGAGVRHLFLEVRPSNGPAIAVYHRLGFQQVGRRKGYYPAGKAADGSSLREDALLMGRLLEDLS